MLAYFDASGDIHGAEALALAGFCGPASSWADWERDWLERIEADGLSCFHRTELALLSETKRLALLADLCEIIVAHGFRRFGVSIINRDLKTLSSKDARRQWHINAYSYTGQCAITRMDQWTKSWSGPFPAMIFEDGDAGRGELIELFRKQQYPPPVFKPKRDRVDKKGNLRKAAIPLQACDLYAYDLFSRARDIARGKEVSKDFSRGVNEIIERLEGDSGVVAPDHIKFMADGLEQMNSLIMQPTVKIDTQTFRR